MKSIFIVVHFNNFLLQIIYLFLCFKYTFFIFFCKIAKKLFRSIVNAKMLNWQTCEVIAEHYEFHRTKWKRIFYYLAYVAGLTLFRKSSRSSKTEFQNLFELSYEECQPLRWDSIPRLFTTHILKDYFEFAKRFIKQ